MPRRAPKEAPERERQLHRVLQEVRRALEANDRQGEEAIRRDGRARQAEIRQRDVELHATGQRGPRQAKEEGPERAQATSVRILPLLSRRTTGREGHPSQLLRGRGGQRSGREMEQGDARRKS